MKELANQENYANQYRGYNILIQLVKLSYAHCLRGEIGMVYLGLAKEEAPLVKLMRDSYEGQTNSTRTYL